MENNKDKKELDDIIEEINNVAKELVDEYVSGEDKFVPEEERTEVNEKLIKAPYKDEELDIPFKVTDEEMEHLINVQKQIKDTLLKETDIYIEGTGRKVDVLRYCQEEGIDNFSILEYIGNDKEKLRQCLKIKTKKQ